MLRGCRSARYIDICIGTLYIRISVGIFAAMCTYLPYPVYPVCLCDSVATAEVKIYEYTDFFA